MRVQPHQQPFALEQLVGTVPATHVSLCHQKLANAKPLELYCRPATPIPPGNGAGRLNKNKVIANLDRRIVCRWLVSLSLSRSVRHQFPKQRANIKGHCCKSQFLC